MSDNLFTSAESAMSRDRKGAGHVPQPATPADHGPDLLATPDCHCCEQSECANELPLNAVCEDCGREYPRGEIHVCGAGQAAQISPEEGTERIGKLLKAADDVCAHFGPNSGDYTPGGKLLAILRIHISKVREL